MLIVIVDDVTSGGREFHVRDAAAGKERSPMSGGMSKERRRPVQTMMSYNDSDFSTVLFSIRTIKCIFVF